MGNLTTSQTDTLISPLHTDDVDKFVRRYLRNNIPINIEWTKKKRTWISFCAYYDSPKCLTFLISKGNDINKGEPTDNSTPLIIASKFGYLDIVNILLENKCDTSVINAYGLNALDIAFIRGNYETCLYLWEHTNLKLQKTLENYEGINEVWNYPLFKMDLFYNCWQNKISPDKVPSFAIESTRKKKFEGKVPDPHENMVDFLKRMGRMELFQPPLVDKDSVSGEVKQSIFMRVQSGLCELEHGVQIDWSDQNKRKEVELKDKPIKWDDYEESGKEGTLQINVSNKDNKEKNYWKDGNLII